MPQKKQFSDNAMLQQREMALNYQDRHSFPIVNPIPSQYQSFNSLKTRPIFNSTDTPLKTDMKN